MCSHLPGEPNTLTVLTLGAEKRLGVAAGNHDGDPSGHTNCRELDPATAEVLPSVPSSHTPGLCLFTLQRHLPMVVCASCALARTALPSLPLACLQLVTPKGLGGAGGHELNLNHGLHPAPSSPNIHKTAPVAECTARPAPLPKEHPPTNPTPRRLPPATRGGYKPSPEAGASQTWSRSGRRRGRLRGSGSARSPRAARPAGSSRARSAAPR